MPPPRRPDDAPPPDRDPLLDDPLFAEIVEPKPAPDLVVEPDLPPALPVAAPAPPPLPPATPVKPRPRAELASPAPPRRVPEDAEPPRPRMFAACGVLGCLGLAFLTSLGFMVYAVVTLFATFADHDDRDDTPAAREAKTARPDPVGPTTFAADRGTLLLDGGVVNTVGRAAGGRYLLLRTSRDGAIHLFDPNAGQVVRKFDTGASNALFAGSASKLFVYKRQPGGGELQRWNLESGAREQDAKVGGVPPDAVVVGAGVDGPVYLFNAPANGVASARVIDPDTLAPVNQFAVPDWRPDADVHVRPSDDGSMVALGSSAGVRVVRLGPAGFTGMSPVWGSALATPARNGGAVYATGGLFDPRGTPKGGVTRYAFPTAHGSGLFLTLDEGPFNKSLAGPLQLHLAAAPGSAAELEDFPLPGGLRVDDTGTLPPDQRIHLWPAAGLAAVILPGGEGKVTLAKIDVAALLKETGAAYLVIRTEPRLWAARGAEWRYAPAAWTSAKGAQTVTLKSGPPGMQVQANQLVWTPGTAATTPAVVDLSVAAGTLTAEQRFQVTVVNAGGE